jgi:translation initiation factor 3 subunit B
MEWPFFRWSHDGNYISRFIPATQKEGPAIAVYDLPALTLVDGKPIKVDHLQEYAWSPGNNYIAYWTPEEGDNPARVTVLDVATRSIVRTKNFFMVQDCKLSWQNDGDFLLVKVERYTKTKKTTMSAIEVFCMRQKEVPIEVFDENIKELTIQSVAWEPSGSRFVMIATSEQKLHVGVYAMDPKAGIKELKFMERKTVNSVFWSPKGHIFVLAGLRNMQGELEWWDADDLGQPIGTGEHFQCTDVQWDPTGRYVTTTVSFWRHPTDTGYTLWDFKGALITKRNTERFKQLLWRPRQPSLLSKEQQKVFISVFYFISFHL